MGQERFKTPRMFPSGTGGAFCITRPAIHIESVLPKAMALKRGFAPCLSGLTEVSMDHDSPLSWRRSSHEVQRGDTLRQRGKSGCLRALAAGGGAGFAAARDHRS